MRRLIPLVLLALTITGCAGDFALVYDDDGNVREIRFRSGELMNVTPITTAPVAEGHALSEAVTAWNAGQWRKAWAELRARTAEAYDKARAVLDAKAQVIANAEAAQ